jgi:hypothetical protein
MHGHRRAIVWQHLGCREHHQFSSCGMGTHLPNNSLLHSSSSSFPLNQYSSCNQSSTMPSKNSICSPSIVLAI